MKYSCLLLLFSLLQVAIATEVYRDVDENGRVVYTQIPPYKGAEKVKLKSSTTQGILNNTSNSVSSHERQKKYLDYLQSERLERQQKREEQKQQRAELAANCYSVRADLGDMNQGGVRYYDLDENGERVFIDESIVEAKRKRLREYLDENCKTILKSSE